jgi:hypothetical protein
MADPTTVSPQCARRNQGCELLTTVWLAVLLFVPAPLLAAWQPQEFSELDTLEYLTVGPEEGQHWSTVWLVVIDGQVYVRLGSRAAERMEKNTAAPYVTVRVGDEEFARIKAESVPDMADAVNKAMADKYTSDFLVRFFNHPLTMRLSP